MGLGSPVRPRELQGHVPILVVSAVALAVRAAFLIAYPGAAFAFSDSWRYLQYAASPAPDPLRPAGFSLWLRLIFGQHPNLLAVVVAQHALGIAVGLALYILLRRAGVRSWLAAAGAAVPLLDGYQITLEHFVLAETAFEALTTGAIAALLWRRRPGWPTTVAVGLLLGCAVLVRTVGVTTICIVAIYLTSRAGWRRAAVATMAAVMPLAGYMAWYDGVHGHLGLEDFNGYAAYSRVAPFAQCGRLHLDAELAQLCPRNPISERRGAYFYVWERASPLQQYERTHPVVGIYQTGNPSPAVNALANRFARQVLLHQPFDYAAAVLTDVLREFSPMHDAGRTGWPIASWRVPTHQVWDAHGHQWLVRGSARRGPLVPTGTVSFSSTSVAVPDRTVTPAGPHPTGTTGSAVYDRGRIHPRLARWLSAYETIVSVPGPLFVAPLVLVIALWWRSRGVAAGAASRSRWGHPAAAPGVFLSAAGLGLLLLPAVSTAFDFRYRLPAQPLLAAGAVCLAEALTRSNDCVSEMSC